MRLFLWLPGYAGGGVAEVADGADVAGWGGCWGCFGAAVTWGWRGMGCLGCDMLSVADFWWGGSGCLGCDVALG